MVQLLGEYHVVVDETPGEKEQSFATTRVRTVCKFKGTGVDALMESVAVMYCKNDDGSESFGYPRSFKILLWFTVLSGSAFIVFLMFVPVKTNSDQIAQYLCIGFFGCLLACLLPVLRLLSEKIHVDDHSITHESHNGKRTALAWTDVARVVDRTYKQRLELHDANGLVMIRVENQIEQCLRLRAIVFERSKWREVEPTPALPATFYRATPHRVIIFGGAGVFAVVGILALFSSEPETAPMFWLFSLAALGCDWDRLQLDHSAITFRHVFWRRRVPIDQIKAIRMGTFRPSQGSVFSSIGIQLHNGKVSQIFSVQGGILLVYRTILTVLPPETLPDDMPAE